MPTREKLLEKSADFVLENGLQSLSLRPLARFCGTSDRMLLYHFGSKEALVAALLERVGERFLALMDAAIPPETAASRAECARSIVAVANSDAFAPGMRLWWELVAGAAAGNAAYRDAAQAISARMLDWVVAHMPADDRHRWAGARRVLALVEGALMLRAIGKPELASLALSDQAGPL